MRFNRRKFLLLAGVSGLGVGVLGRQLMERGSAGSSLSQQPAIQTNGTNPSPAVAQPSGKPLLRFVAIADTGTGYADQYAVAVAMNQYRQRNPYQLVILAGDNIYTNGEISKVKEVFEEPYQPLLTNGVKFHACLGNHDIRTDNGEPQLRYAGFNMPQRYYTFREKDVQFFALDTNGNADWTAQLAWLEQELKRSTAVWKIVFGHHPIYSSGHYGTDQALVDSLTPLFQKCGVQLYINGHEHHYERTQPIKGTTYLITGIGGAQLRPVGRSSWTAFSTSRYGFSAIEIHPDRMEITAIGADHQVFDRGTIQLKTFKT
jgi:3',5'-cyclic AMP phosphodiesterase CpdA